MRRRWYALVEALKYHKLYQLETDSLYNAEKERAVGRYVKIRYGTAGKRDKTKPSGIIGKGK